MFIDVVMLGMSGCEIFECVVDCVFDFKVFYMFGYLEEVVLSCGVFGVDV